MNSGSNKSKADSARPVRTLGPVSDLERHLPGDWWKTLFNSVYLKTDGDVVENNENTKAEIDMLLQACELDQDSELLDLCCGQGRHTLELARRGFNNLHGFDRSQYLIRLARKRARTEGLRVKFSEGDARRIHLPESSKDCVIIMGNSFGYFEREEDDLEVLRSIMRVLRSRGKLVLDVVDAQWMAKNFEPRTWEWIDQEHFVNRERSLSADGKRIVSREVVTHANVGVIADQFYAERLYSEEDLRSILGDLGFTDIVCHGSLQSGSTRGQDLGMMANRLFLSAVAPQKKPKKAIPASKRKITVVMGDPRLPDSVKRDGKFNEEDFHTIAMLKDALAKLEDFQFSFMDNHRNLIQKLQDSTPEFVFNLCDEGYNNHANLELHVPALLEMLNVPYSGAAPGCLSLCYDKAKVRAICAAMDLPVPLETYYNPSDQAATLPSIFPALLKPACGDSSIGITQNAVVNDAGKLLDYINYLRETLPNVPVLIQEYLTGAEYSVGLVGNPGNLEALPLLEVDYSQLPENLPKILSYESKWMPESPYWTQISYRMAEVDDEKRNLMIEISRQLFERLECRDYARFDFRCDAQGQPKLLEVNPNPGWCWDGKFNLMAEYANMDYSQLLQMILNAALERSGLQAVQSATHIPAH
ncbi:MAG: methyltransferase domain-containing protein [Gammaproteobacteria bacterium]|nr:methyltransferase domain-containing protein [Gammaproteobacteria bacterium]